MRTALCGTALVLASLAVASAPAQAATLDFDSTNISSYNPGKDVGTAGGWWAFKFTAVETTTITSVTVYVDDATNSSQFNFNLATAFNSGSLGAYSPTSVAMNVSCDTDTCDTVTFTGSATLTAGNDYWIWIGSSGPDAVTIPLFTGAAATQSGLALGYTLASSDIRSSSGFVTHNSRGRGYPWIRMFRSTATSAPSQSNGPSQSTVPEFSINLITSDAAQCNQRDMSAPRGVWVKAPSATDCSPPTARPTATLLGWATKADFSVDIAQRQVDNGWGAYETFNNTGQLTGVFIPAGGYTLVTNDTNLYPIWSE